MSSIIKGSEPFFWQVGATGCVLLHGFSASPAEVRPLGEFLTEKGFTVMGTRLAGHATHPNELKHTRWEDWLVNVEESLALLSGICSKRVLIGQSLGGMIALIGASQFEVSAVVAISTPCDLPSKQGLNERLYALLHPIIQKSTRRFPSEHALYHRRELDYPAYPEFPAGILKELKLITKVMTASLSQVKIPTLMIHSRDDAVVPFECMQAIYDRLGSPNIEMLAMEGMEHSLLMDAKRQVVFEAVEKFLKTIV